MGKGNGIGLRGSLGSQYKVCLVREHTVLGKDERRTAEIPSFGPRVGVQP